MMIIGCDFHTRYQQIAMVDEATGELVERRLDHESGEAHTFYRGLPKPVRVGIEAKGPLQWFERLLAELGHELWIGDSHTFAPAGCDTPGAPRLSFLSLFLANVLIASSSSPREPRSTTPPAGCPTVRGFPNRGRF